MKRLIFSMVIILLIGVPMTSNSSDEAKDHVFWGRVLDADTKEPIEGAAIVLSWYEAWPTPAGQASKLYDVKETLTNEKGEWKIVGPKGRPIDRSQNSHLLYLFLTGGTYIREPGLIIFKPGYCPWQAVFSITACNDKIQTSGPGEVMEGKYIELPRLTKREDRLIARRIGPIYELDGERKKEILKKQREFIKLLNQESRNLGLEEIKQ